ASPLRRFRLANFRAQLVDAAIKPPDNVLYAVYPFTFQHNVQQQNTDKKRCELCRPPRRDSHDIEYRYPDADSSDCAQCPAYVAISLGCYHAAINALALPLVYIFYQFSETLVRFEASSQCSRRIRTEETSAPPLHGTGQHL